MGELTDQVTFMLIKYDEPGGFWPSMSYSLMQQDPGNVCRSIDF